MMYGAEPGTVTGRLSVPHQNPAGPSLAGRAAAADAVPWVSAPASRSTAQLPRPASAFREYLIITMHSSSSTLTKPHFARMSVAATRIGPGDCRFHPAWTRARSARELRIPTTRNAVSRGSRPSATGGDGKRPDAGPGE